MDVWPNKLNLKEKLTTKKFNNSPEGRQLRMAQQLSENVSSIVGEYNHFELIVYFAIYMQTTWTEQPPSMFPIPIPI